MILALDKKLRKNCKIEKEEEISESASRPLVGFEVWMTKMIKELMHMFRL
jgi:hypothetical protein